MTCCIEKSSIFAAAFGKCIYKVSNIQYYFNQKIGIRRKEKQSST